MDVRPLPSSLSLKGKRVLVRVDWNVPLKKSRLQEEDAVKIKQSVSFLHNLSRRGAVVILLTHLGRPEGRDLAYSTRVLADVVNHQFGMGVVFHPEAFSKKQEFERLRKALIASGNGSIHLLENVRFEKGEEKNDARLADLYAQLGEVFINDAFASCHRAHASVVGIAKKLPSYAGPNLRSEIQALDQLLHHQKKPFVTVIGGFKISSKLPVLKKLARLSDAVCIGGAMASTLLAAKGVSLGESFVEKEALAEAKQLARQKNILLPTDVRVSHALKKGVLKECESDHVPAHEIVVDIGRKTIAEWGAILKRAKTILWNGPVGIVEHPAFARGTNDLLHLIANCRAYKVAGGGDTVPLIFAQKKERFFDHISMGGGALLEFVERGGRLPGLAPLVRR
ncbi:MAG TPA: phosphoglycerate kinase [Patescibacteria group bacterium]|nr:phosphoglycerate kinase [Patescibacteria group bacterium]